MTDKKNNKKILLILIGYITLMSILTYIIGLLNVMSNIFIRIFINVLLTIFMGVIAGFAMKITGIDIKSNFNIKIINQYIIGVIMALILSFVIAFIPAICGTSIIGNHMEFSFWNLVYYFVYYLLVVGPVEEFIFRVYIQDTLLNFFKNKKYIAVLISSTMFGLWHIINGNIFQVCFTFLIGCAFGFSKCYLKNCTFISCSLGHGLYDFLNIIIRFFII